MARVHAIEHSLEIALVVVGGVPPLARNSKPQEGETLSVAATIATDHNETIRVLGHVQPVTLRGPDKTSKLGITALAPDSIRWRVGSGATQAPLASPPSL